MFICKECEFSRNTWSEKLHKEGYIGCVILLKYEDVDLHSIDGELYEGWITSTRYSDKWKKRNLAHKFSVDCKEC